MSLLIRPSRLSAPSYSLSINGSFANKALVDRLVSLSVTLNNGEISDQLSLTIDDRPTRSFQDISAPTLGVEITVSMGYELYKAEMGKFIVNSVNFDGSSGGRSISISATPPLLTCEAIRTWPSEDYPVTFVADVIDTIAKSNNYGLTAAVSPSFKTVRLDVINQMESDSRFLMRLASLHNAVCKPMAGKLLFMKKGQGTSASGKPMLPVKVFAQDVLQWSMQENERQDYGRVVARWQDLKTGQQAWVQEPRHASGQSGEALVLPYLYLNKEDATNAAQTKWSEINREAKTLSLTIIGNPDITAEGKIIVSNLRSDIDRTYIVKSATHSFSSGGYQTSIQAYVEP